MVASTLPDPEMWNLSFAGLVIAIALLGIGGGEIKPNVNPLLAEQYTRGDEMTIDAKTGKPILVDRAATIQR